MCYLKTVLVTFKFILCQIILTNGESLQLYNGISENHVPKLIIR